MYKKILLVETALQLKVIHMKTNVSHFGLNMESTLLLGFPGGSAVKNLPVIQETWVQSLGQEDALEEEMAAHSNILAWRISWPGKPCRLQPMGLHRVRHNRSDLAHTHHTV